MNGLHVRVSHPPGLAPALPVQAAHTSHALPPTQAAGLETQAAHGLGIFSVHDTGMATVALRSQGSKKTPPTAFIGAETWKK